MAVKFSVPLESAANFPTPTILASPKFRLNFLTFKNHLGSDTEHCIYTQNGRGAIAIAGEVLKREGDNVVLIPAYHCPALVEPFIWLNYKIMFYPINSDLTVDLDVLRSMIESGGVTHCVLIRYFGFAQNVDAAEVVLKKKDISIIEDCAHAFFAFQENILTESSASDAQICSINKLLPSIDGGALYMPKHHLPKLNAHGWVSEFKGILHTLGISQLLLKFKKSEGKVHQSVPSTSGIFRYFVPDERYVASYRHTVWLAKQSHFNKIKKIRRDNFRYMVEKLKNSKIGNPLYTELKENEIPYVLPFVLNNSEHFKTLRMKGIQVLRWEEIAESDCPVSAKYREHLLQLPCHHQLSITEIDELIKVIKELGEE